MKAQRWIYVVTLKSGPGGKKPGEYRMLMTSVLATSRRDAETRGYNRLLPRWKWSGDWWWQCETARRA